MPSLIRIQGRMVEGVFMERLTRFSASVKVEGKIVACYLPNPGRMVELLVPGVEVVLKGALGGERKTSYDLIEVYHKGDKISLDSRVPNKLVLEALRDRELSEFSGYSSINPEYQYGGTRFDFFLSNGDKSCLLEVKSCTKVREGVALFPDARTVRGRRQVRDLLEAKNKGYRSCILFVIQRTDVEVFSPDDEVDREFGDVLRQAAKQGVEVYAYCSQFVGDKIILRGKVDVNL